MAKIVLMCGIPGSGKSYYAKEHKGENDIYISRDEIRFSILKEGEDYFAKETLVYNSFIDLINKALQIKGIDTIWVDATHISKASRSKIIRRILPRYSSLEAVYMNTPNSICEYRNSQREGRTRVPIAQIKRMEDQLVQPQLTEGFSKITIVENFNGEEKERIYER